MEIKLISEDVFESFSSSHPLKTYYQTSKYARYMQTKGYSYEFVGLYDNSELLAASLILYKKTGLFSSYGYAPRGFLIDYRNYNLVNDFTNLLTKFYSHRGFAFIKVNPDVAKNYYDKELGKFFPGPNWDISKVFNKKKYTLLDNLSGFNSVLPTYNAVIPLRDFNIKSVNLKAKNNIMKNIKHGVFMTKGDRGNLYEIFEFVKKFGNRSFEDYLSYYDYFSETQSIDCFLLKIDYSKALDVVRNLYFAEEERNNRLVNLMLTNGSDSILKDKMKSDLLLSKFNESIKFYSSKIGMNNEDSIAGAITIKFDNRIYIITSGYDTSFKHLSPNYYLYYKLCEFYRDDYDFIDLNGFGGEVSDNNPFNGLNKFKLSFNPICYETVGEMDLVVNKFLYKQLIKKGVVSNEFSKKRKKVY